MEAELRELLRQDRLNEPGTMPPCPFCQRARVQRSDYVRCNPCGLNWLEGENLALSPHLSREPYLSWKRTKDTGFSETGQTGTAQPAD